jgi:hypothetical protein
MAVAESHKAKIERCQEAGICSICEKPLDYSDGYHSASHSHWNCHKNRCVNTDSDKRNMDSALSLLGIKPKQQHRPLGEGRIGKRLTKFLIDALVEENGGEVIDIMLWNQPAAYRGGISDLACWGGHAKFGGGDRRQISFHSWNTMTACVKSGGIKLTPEDNAFDVNPKS